MHPAPVISSQHVQAILEQVGYTGCSLLDRAKNWQYWSAELQSPSRNIPERVLYLSYACGWSDLEAAAATIKRFEGAPLPTVVVRNLEARFNGDVGRISRIVASSAVISLSNLLYNTARLALRNLSDSIVPALTSDLEYFVEPDIRYPDANKEESCLPKLTRWLRGEVESPSNVAVLLAPAATGKSTVSKSLFLHIIKNHRAKVFPLLVSSEQWSNLAKQELLGLPQIWSAAIGDVYPSAVVGSEQIEKYLSYGTICPIFDGLDELCSFFPGSFNSTETVLNLTSSFNAQDESIPVLNGRLLLTSRTRFWEGNVEPAVRKGVVEIELFPFTAEQRQKYFIKRFPDDRNKQQRAQQFIEILQVKTGTHTELNESGTVLTDPSQVATVAQQRRRYGRIDRLPYVVVLAAETADAREAVDVEETLSRWSDPVDPVGALLEAYCERERGRQRIRISAAQQVAILEAIAAELPDKFDPADLDLCVRMILTQPNIDDEEVQRMRDHDVLSCHRDQYAIRFPFVREYLRARTLRRWLAGGEEVPGIDRVLRLCATEPGSLLERSSELIRAAGGGLWVQNAKRRWAKMPLDDRMRAGFFHLLQILSKDQASNVKRDVTGLLLRALSEEDSMTFHHLYLMGSANGLDLSGITFEKCQFNDIEFINCVFDSETRFEDCRFIGTFGTDYCKGFDQVEHLDMCYLSSAARSCFQAAQAGRTAFPITADQIRDAVSDVLRRFARGAAGFVTRKEEGVRRSVGRACSFGDELLSTLERTGVLETFTSQGDKMFRVSATRAARLFLDNRVPVGEVNSAVQQLVRRLVKR